MPNKPKIIISKAQIMHVITALVIVPVSGWVATVVARYFPGIPGLTPTAVEGIFITGCAAALGLGIHYLHGWQLWERTVGRVVDVEDKALPPAQEGHLLQGGPRDPAVIVHVHGANPSGHITAESGGQPAEEVDVTGSQAATSPATPETQAITGA